jgi:integrase
MTGNGESPLSCAGASLLVATAAGIGRVHPHQMRHTLAAQAINRGMRGTLGLRGDPRQNSDLPDCEVDLLRLLRLRVRHVLSGIGTCLNLIGLNCS